MAVRVRRAESDNPVSAKFFEFRTKYSPRARRAGVRSYVLAVSVRARGPMKGRQPIVTVIVTAKRTTTAMKDHARMRPSLVIEMPSLI